MSDDRSIDEVGNDTRVGNVFDSIFGYRTRADHALGTEEDALCSISCLHVRDTGRPHPNRAIEYATFPILRVTTRYMSGPFHAAGIRLAFAISGQKAPFATRSASPMEVGLLTVGSVEG